MRASRTTMNSEFISQLQKRLAETAIGPSTLRNQGSKGVVQIARDFLRAIDLRDFLRRNSNQYQNVLDKHTEELRRSFPRNAQNWGAARKALNIFLRDSFYNRYLYDEFSLGRLEFWLELPLDKYVGEALLTYDRTLPRWRSIKYLTPRDSSRYQQAASRWAGEKNMARIHLDIWLWRSEQKEQTF